MPGKKSIFQLMCERILKLKELTAAKKGGEASKVPFWIRWGTVSLSRFPCGAAGFDPVLRHDQPADP